MVWVFGRRDRLLQLVTDRPRIATAALRRRVLLGRLRRMLLTDVSRRHRLRCSDGTVLALLWWVAGLVRVGVDLV